MGFGLSRKFQLVRSGAAARKAAEKLEISSINPRADREKAFLSASRLAGKVVGSIPTRSTNLLNELERARLHKSGLCVTV